MNHTTPHHTTSRHALSGRAVQRIGALLVAPALVIAACGGDDDEDAAATTLPATTTMPTTPATTMPETTMPATTMPETSAPGTTDPSTSDPMTSTTTDDTGDGTQDDQGGDLDDLGDSLAGTGADIFVSLLNLVGLDEVTDADEVTVFVPNDDAFTSLDAEQLATLIDDPDQVLEILRAHVVEGAVTSDDLQDGDTLTAVSGDELQVVVAGDTVEVGGATVVRADLTFDGGVVHVIDGVLLLTES